MPRKPLGWMGAICQAQDATRPKGDSQARPVAIRSATQGAFGLSKSPRRGDHRARAGISLFWKGKGGCSAASAVTGHPVAHRLTLDPCGLAYSLLRSRAFTPKVVPGARLDNRVPSASPVQP